MTTFNHQRFRNTVQKQQVSNKKKREKFIDELTKERLTALRNWYRCGGQIFLDWAKVEYRTYSGEMLRWDEPFLEEFFLFMGNPWIEKGIIEKAAQMGYTEVMTALTAFALGYLRIPIGVGFEEQSKTQEMVGSRIQPSFDHIEAIQQLIKGKREHTGRQDIDTKRGITVAGVKASFFYAGTRSRANNARLTTERQAASRLSSFTAFMILCDEIELWAKGIMDILRQRMAASNLPTKPIRAGSTPGHEGGIVDNEVKTSSHYFKWEVTCPNCGEAQRLDPFGNFLRPFEVEQDGKREIRFIDAMGRPYRWFHHCNENDPLPMRWQTAYIGCRECAAELTRDILDSGQFTCDRTGISLREFDAQITQQKTIVVKAALRLPRLASVLFNPRKKIEELWTSDNPADEIQQGLGKAFSLGAGKIPLEAIRSCIGIAPPDRQPDLIVLGADQGHHANYVVLQHWYLADSPDKETKWREAHKEIVWWGEVGFHEFDDLVQKYNIDIISLDNEPEYNSAGEYAIDHPPLGNSITSLDGVKTEGKGQVYLIDQKELSGVRYKRNEVILQNTKNKTKDKKRYIIYDIDRNFFLDKVRDRIINRQTHFPSTLVYEPRDKSNLIVHYLSSDRVDGRWIKAEPDHYFHADSMGDAAVLCSFYEPGMGGGYSYGYVNFW